MLSRKSDQGDGGACMHYAHYHVSFIWPATPQRVNYVQTRSLAYLRVSANKWRYAIPPRRCLKMSLSVAQHYKPEDQHRQKEIWYTSSWINKIKSIKIKSIHCQSRNNGGAIGASTPDAMGKRDETNTFFLISCRVDFLNTESTTQQWYSGRKIQVTASFVDRYK